jgi:hypothetical protein
LDKVENIRYARVGSGEVVKQVDPGILVFIFGVPILILIVMIIVLLRNKKPSSETFVNLGQSDEEIARGLESKPGLPLSRAEMSELERKPVDPKILDIQKLREKGRLNTLYHFMCEEGANKGESFYITKYVSTIGRRSTDGRVNDIEFAQTEKKVSRTQALLVFHPQNDRFYLINEATAPINVNSKPIEQAFPLKEGDRIEMGGGDIVLSFIKHR